MRRYPHRPLSRRIAALAAVAAVAGAQSSGQTAFVFLVGADTLGIERFTATRQAVSGDILLRGQPRMTYMAARDAAGRVAGLQVVVYPSGGGPDAAPLQNARLRIERDTGVADITAAGSTRTERFATSPDAFLLLNSSVAMLEIALARLGGGARDSVTFPVLLAAGGQTVQATLRRLGADSIRLRLGPQETELVARDGRIVRLRTPAQRLVVERVEGEAARSLTLGKPDYGVPPGAPYRAEDVTIRTPAGHTLAGTLTIPQGVRGRLPAVVTITGSGPQDRDEYLALVPGFRPFRQVADTLGRRGIAVLRYDDRGTGESTGDFAAATSGDFADDVRAAIAWLRARPDVDANRVALLGHSEGGLIAPIVAASDSQLAGIVLLAGPSKRGREVLDDQIRYGVDHDSSLAARQRDSAFAARRAAADTTAAPRPWMRFFLQHDPLATISRVKVPVLVLQGATDRQVTAEQADSLGAALRRAGNRDVSVRVLPHRNHLFLLDSIGAPSGYARLASGRIGPEVLGEIADWLAGKLRRPGGGMTLSLPPFLELRVPMPPTVATAEGAAFLVYELHVTNFAAQPMTLKRIEVLAADTLERVVHTVADSGLVRSLARPGGGVPAAERAALAGGARAIVYLWVPVDRATSPRALRHRVTVERGSGDSLETESLDGPSVRVVSAGAPIGPPLRGGVWLAANGPAPETGHRRALIPVGGVAAIAQRFAIDYVKVGEDFRTFHGDSLKNESYYAHGTEALAVADGIVVAVKDGIPENVPGPTSRAVPITLETVGGNHVIIDIGGGRYAFYAHLQPGSLRVRLRDRVRRGQVVGLVGNSGNSTEPHLHFHIADGTSPLGSEGLPYAHESFEIVGRCRTLGAGCERTAPALRRAEVPLANILVRFQP